MEEYIRRFLGACTSENYQRAYEIVLANPGLIAKLNNLTLSPNVNGNDILLAVHSDFIAKGRDREAIEFYNACVMDGNDKLINLLDMDRLLLHKHIRYLRDM